MTPNVSVNTAGSGKVYNLQHDWAGRTELSTELVLAIQRITGKEAAALEPFSNSINPDALNHLFGAAADEDGDGEVSFRYSGTTITIHSSGDVRIVADTEER